MSEKTIQNIIKNIEDNNTFFTVGDNTVVRIPKGKGSVLYSGEIDNWRKPESMTFFGVVASDEKIYIKDPKRINCSQQVPYDNKVFDFETERKKLFNLLVDVLYEKMDDIGYGQEDLYDHEQKEIKEGPWFFALGYDPFFRITASERNGKLFENAYSFSLLMSEADYIKVLTGMKDVDYYIEEFYERNWRYCSYQRMFREGIEALRNDRLVPLFKAIFDMPAEKELRCSYKGKIGKLCTIQDLKDDIMWKRETLGELESVSLRRGTKPIWTRDSQVGKKKVL